MNPKDNDKIRFRTSIDDVYPLGAECWSEIDPLIYCKELGKNEYFSREGQINGEFGFLQNGILRIFYLNDRGEEWNKHFLQRGDFVAASISPEKKSVTNIQALSKTRISCIPYAELLELSVRYKTLGRFLQKLTFEYLEKKQAREIRLLSEDSLSNYRMFKTTFPGLEPKIQQYHIASYLGITPTQLSRLRKKMKPNQHM